MKSSTLTAVAAGLLLPIIGLQTLVVYAQSGRGRPRVAPPSTTAPPPPVTIPADAAVVKQEQNGFTSRVVLRNGITVIVDEQHSLPIAAAVACVRRTDKSADARLVSALVQRIILRGTVTRPQGKAVADLRALGGQLDAFITQDASVLAAVGPSSKLKETLAIQSDLVRNALLDAEDVRRELQLASDELKAFGNLSSDSTRLARAQLDQNDDPWPIKATESNISSVTRERLLDSYRSAFNPANLVVVVVGDVVPYTALIEVQQSYGNFVVNPRAAATSPSGKPKPGVAVSTTTPKSAQADARAGQSPTTTSPDNEAATPKPSDSVSASYYNERLDIRQGRARVEFPGPGLESPDWSAIEVLTSILGIGRASRLHRTLIDAQLAADRVEASYIPGGETSVIRFQLWPTQDARGAGSLDSVESGLFRELDRIRRELVSEGELARAKSILEERFLELDSSFLNRAIRMGLGEASQGGIADVVGYRSKIRSVRAEDVQKVAGKYLIANAAVVREIEPLSAPPRTFDADRFAATVATWAPGFSKPVDSASIRPADPTQSSAPLAQSEERPARESIEPLPVKDFSTLNGPRAFVREDHAHALVTIALFFQGGRLLETASNAGITELMLRSMIYGTARRSYNQLTDELEQRGARLEAVSEADFFGFVLSVPSRNADRVLRILRDIVEEPAFREDEVKRAALGQLFEIRSDRDSLVSNAQMLLRASLFPGHAYAMPPHGTEEILVKITAEQLQEWHAKLIKRQYPLIVIVGDTDGSALVSGQLAEGFRRRDLDTSLQVKLPAMSAPGEKADTRNQPVNAIALGYSGPKGSSSDRAALALLVEAMNGPGGLLWRELRDKQGLALGSFFASESWFAGGSISICAIGSMGKEPALRAAMLSLLQGVGRVGLNEKDFEGAMAAAFGARLSQLQSQRFHALEYARAVYYQQQAASVDGPTEDAVKITPEELKRATTTYLKGTPSIGVIRSRAQK